ncbi:MAG: DnaK suppressor protein [Candidatus Azotimanducaceae bacterium]|jgi:DnaK suppressor protein
MSMTTEARQSYKAIDHYMNEEQRGHFKLALSNWKQQLLEEDSNAIRSLANGASNDADPADRASQAEELDLVVRTQARLRRLVRKIDSSIKLIDQNDYGYCEACGVEIGLLRLQARLTACQCIDCKSIAELKELQIRL